MGTIYKQTNKRADGTVRTAKCYTLVYRDATGKRRWEATTLTSYAQAKALLAQREGGAVVGELPSNPKVTLGNLLTDYVNDLRANGKASLADTERRIRLHIEPFFGAQRQVVTLATADVRRFTVARQAAGASNGEVNRELAIIRRALRLGQQEGRIRQHPHVPMLAEAPARVGFFTDEQVADVCAHLTPEVGAVVRFLYLTGWRLREGLTLQWRNVDFRAGEVRLDAAQSKNRDGRVFPMTHELRALLLAQQQATKALGRIVPWVFHRHGKPIATFRTQWKSACTAAGLPGRIVHDLRRSAVRNFVRRGIPERVAMTLTGHKTRSVFERYNIVSEADLKAAAAALDAAAGQ